jgi:hypothetical protein
LGFTASGSAPKAGAAAAIAATATTSIDSLLIILLKFKFYSSSLQYTKIQKKLTNGLYNRKYLSWSALPR